jgi:eukaryotic-like serine/threonine-protein kinase
VTPERSAGPSSAVLAVFDEVVDLDPLAREERLSAIGASDPSLREAVERLIAADAQVDAKLARIERAIGSGVAGGPARDADPLKLVGRTVSHFRVVESLAAGGMGVVYRAEDTQLQRAIALKFPLPTQHTELSSRKRFLHEARVAGGLDHPNLYSIYETGETEEGYLFYAMPFYQGETLRERLAREGALPIADALDIARQVSRGVSAAHRAGIVHRDLKPANVMLLPDGTVKVLDFGLAKARDLTLTAPEMLLGTVAYMAPEQILEGAGDSRADLWALGVMLYEMLAGRRPFEGGHEVSIAHSIVHADPPRLSTLRAGISSELEAVVAALLCRDPADRFQSFEALVSALGSIESGESVRAQLPPRRSVLRRIRRRVTPRVATVASLLLAAGALSAWIVVRPAGPAPPPMRIAVLPLTDLSDTSENAVLGVGLGDAISTELARISALALPSFRSMVMYRGSTPLRETVPDLGFKAIVQGTVERAGTGVLGDVELIDARTGEVLWSRRFDGTATAIDVERQITRGVVSALRVRLTDAERTVLNRPATADARAYDLYVRGRGIGLQSMARVAMGSAPEEREREVQALFAQASALDPSFALARARLAFAHLVAAQSYDPTEPRREQARIEAETALRLHPGLSEAHFALYVYWAQRSDHANALEEAKLSLRSSPGNAERHVHLGSAYRNAARWDDAIASYQYAMQLDPLDSFAYRHASDTFARVHREEEALRALDRVIELRPDDNVVALLRGHAYLGWKGTADTLLAIASRLPVGWDTAGAATHAKYTALRAQRRYADALAMLDQSRSEVGRLVLPFRPRSLMRAEMHHGLGQSAAARAQYDTARALLEDTLAKYTRVPQIRLALALAYAGLDRVEDAVREANLALETAAPTRGPAGTHYMAMAVEVFARVGEPDRAFDLLELLFTMPTGRIVSVPLLRIWPGFDPLRGDPRFDQLLERFAAS